MRTRTIPEVTAAIADAINTYDASLEVHPDDVRIIDFVNEMGIDTPM